MPPTMPMMSPIVVSIGIISIMAMSFGITRKRSGMNPIVRMASISSETFIVPISAANADPARPVATIATIIGPSSRTTEQPTSPGRNASAPYLCIWTAHW